MPRQPRVLIEDWLPITELGIESRREAAPIPGQFPKLKTLHVWWARRPLAASAGAILGSVLPAWTEGLAAKFEGAPELQDRHAYEQWFLRLCGVLGDPIAAKALAAHNAAQGIRSQQNPFTYKPAFKNSPSRADLELLHAILESTWQEIPVVSDPTAGGGSIPFEASRYGLCVLANDLNPVAAAILEAGVALPARHGSALAADIRRFGKVLVDRCTSRLAPYFPSGDHERVTNYLFARTVTCPRTGKPVPLSPNWWLSKGKGGTAARLITEREGSALHACEFEIVRGKDIDFDPNRGTVAGGDALSPWDGLAIDGDYIKAEAQARRMGSQLYAVVIRTANGRGFRAPTELDLEALAQASAELGEQLERWLSEGLIPDESIDTISNYNRGHRLYGIEHWREMFSARQLLVHGTFVDEFRRLVPEVRSELDESRAEAVLAVLGIMQGKALNWNAISSSWDTSRDKMRSVFDSHNFAFKWTYGEFEGAYELMPWCLDQVVDAYSGIAELLQPSDAQSLDGGQKTIAPGRVSVTAANAAHLSHVAQASVTFLCIDPPYYDNVMYAELADFFYVWEKRTLGLVHPEFFTADVCDKQNEAVANAARFADMGSRKKELATADYEAKMASIFAEAARVLRDDGVMTVMFTHKRAEAWDTLGMGLMQAGFTIETSWPVNTESEQSLHQAKKNAAASTIVLVCRKREAMEADVSQPYFEDLEADVREAARDALLRFRDAGIEGVDLLLATYGPALSVVSAVWPVYSSEADPETGRSRLLRPEEALTAARSEVVRLQRARLLGAPIVLDPFSDFALLAWDTFRAAEFPFDEARRLALAVGGLDIDSLASARLLVTKAGTVELLPPGRRVRRGDEDGGIGVRPDAVSFTTAIDAVHTCMYVADEDGLPAAKALIDRAGLATDSGFLACLQGLVNAVPRTKQKGDWVRPEAGTLDRICSLYFPDIDMPAEPTGVVHGEQEELELDA